MVRLFFNAKATHAAAVVQLLAILMTLPQTTSAGFNPCKGNSLSVSDASFLEWLIDSGLTQQNCEKSLSTYSGAVQPILATPCNKQSNDERIAGERRAIREIQLNLISNQTVVIEDLLSQLNSLDCVQAITVEAKGSAAADILTNPLLKELPVKHLSADVNGTFLDWSFSCLSGSPPRGVTACPKETPLELVLPKSLVTLTVKGGQSAPLSRREPRMAVLPLLPKSMRELRLRNTQIGGKLPPRLPKNMRRIELKENLFKGKVPMAWKNAKKLEAFVVIENELRSRVGRYDKHPDVLDEENLWPKLQELRVHYGSKTDKFLGNFIWSDSQRSPLKCQGFICRRYDDCDRGSRKISCVTVGKEDARFYKRFDSGFREITFNWYDPSSAYRLPEVEQCMQGANSQLGDVERIYEVRVLVAPEGRRAQSEFIKRLNALPCLLELKFHFCDWLPELGASPQLKRLTIANDYSFQCRRDPWERPELKTLSLPPSLEELDIFERTPASSLPQELPIGLQKFSVRLDPSKEWVIPEGWAALTELRILSIKSEDGYRLALALSPVFGNMNKLETLKICLKTPMPKLTRAQLCDKDVTVGSCTSSYENHLTCPSFDSPTAISWITFGGIVLSAALIFSMRGRIYGIVSRLHKGCPGVGPAEQAETITRTLRKLLPAVFFGAVGANMWLAVETMPSTFSILMIGIAVLHYIVSLLFFMRVSTGKDVWFHNAARGDKSGVFDVAWFVWRFKGGPIKRCLKTALLASVGPLVLDFASIVHEITGKDLAGITSEIDLEGYLSGRVAMQGVTVSLVQAIAQSSAFNMINSYEGNALVDVPVWTFVTTMAFSQASILVAGIILFCWIWGAPLQKIEDKGNGEFKMDEKAANQHQAV